MGCRVEMCTSLSCAVIPGIGVAVVEQEMAEPGSLCENRIVILIIPSNRVSSDLNMK